VSSVLVLKEIRETCSASRPGLLARQTTPRWHRPAPVQADDHHRGSVAGVHTTYITVASSELMEQI
jgi:hypothetical protein